MSTDVRLALIILAVRGRPRAMRFYREAFDLAQTVDAPAYAEFALPLGPRLGLYERRSFGANTGQVPTAVPKGELAGTEIYFYVEDVHLAITSLEAAGARKLTPLAERDWGDEAAYFADPGGNVLVLARPLAL